MNLVQAGEIIEFTNWSSEKKISMKIDTSIYDEEDNWAITAAYMHHVGSKVRENHNVGDVVFSLIGSGNTKPEVFLNVGGAVENITIRKVEGSSFYESKTGEMFYVPKCNKEEVTITGLHSTFLSIKTYEEIHKVGTIWNDCAIVVDGKVIKTVSTEKSADELKNRASQLLGL